MTACIHGDVCREYVRRFSHLCRKGLFSGGDGYACILSRDCPSGCRFYEPKRERTCRNVPTVPGKFTCSRCHQSWRLAAGNGGVAYCQSCGAKVVPDA